MMRRILNWKIGAWITAITISVTSYIVIAATSCGDEVCIGLPEITEGEVVDGQFYTGAISIGAEFDAESIDNKEVYYSLDAGVSWTPAGINTSQISLPLPAKANWIDVAPLANGDIAVSWVQPYREQTLPYPRGWYYVYAQVFDYKGQPKNTAVRVDTLLDTTFLGNNEINQGATRVAALPDGGFVVGWQTFTGTINDPLRGKYMRRFSGTGAPVGETIFINSGLRTMGFVVFPSGELSVTWGWEYDTGITDWVSALFVKRYDSQLKPIGKSIVDPADNNGHEKALRLENDNYVITWGNYVSSGGEFDVYARCYTESGSPLGNRFRVNTYNVDRQYEPRITGLAGGGFVITWISRNQDGSGTGIYGQRFNTDCSKNGAEFRVNDYVAGNQGIHVPSGSTVFTGGHDLTTLGGGEVYTIWNSEGFLYPRYKILFSTDTTEKLFPNVGIGGYEPSRIEYLPGNGLFYVSKTPNYAKRILPLGMAFIVPLPFGKFQVKALTPEQDISIQFKVVDPGSGLEWFSPVRNYLYSNPNDGEGGSISYTHGYTNSTSELVTIDMPCTTCVSLQLYQRSAPLTNDSCGAFAAWTEYGSPSTLDISVLTAVDHGQCYQYMATATNKFGYSFDYTSANTLKVDQTQPVISVASQTQNWDQLTLSLSMIEPITYIAGATYQLNNNPAVAFFGNSFTVALLDGLNRLTITATDAAGNVGVLTHFVTVDLTPAKIIIHGIEDGGVYSGDLPLLYSFTQPLTDVVVLVDGQPRADLNGLSNGVHTLMIQGIDAKAEVISKTITFTIDSTLFTVSLLSPQSRQYETNTVDIQYVASKPVSRVWYKLNGGPDASELVLSELADGSYTLVLSAESDTGTVATTTVSFSIKLGVPSLQVVTPVAGETYPVNQVQVSFAANGPVQYQLDGGVTSPISSGDFVDVIGEGQHSLTLTVTHPVSGNVASETVQFTTDTQALQVEVLSPQPRLYAHSEIPVDYKVNKPVKNISLTLDGETVTDLSGLTPGLHTFLLTVEDAAGRIVERQVQFTLSLLEIVTPQDGEVVVSNSNPPVLPFQFNASGEFTTFTTSLDNGPRQLLLEPPGSVIPMIMAPGKHEIRLQGDYNEFSVGRRSQFRIGAKNISTSPGSMNYQYDNCDIDKLNCDVYVTLSIKNSGDLDVNESFQVRFDHIADSGFETQLRTVSSLAVGATLQLTLDPFRARIGDTLMMTVDPLAEAKGEWPDDNVHSITFELGQILDVKSQLSSKNGFIEGVSAFNMLAAITAGSVSSIEVHMGGWVFADDSPADGFVALGDMGLLSKGNNCVQVVAKGVVQEVLDSKSICFDVKELALQDFTPVSFPWAQFETSPNYVVTNTLNMQDMALALAEAKHQSLLQPATIIPKLQDDGNIDYKLITDPAAVQSMAYNRTLAMGGAPIVGENAVLPNGHGLFITSLKTVDATCNMDGAIPILTEARTKQLDEKYANEIAEINEAFKVDELVDFENKLAILSFSSLGSPYFNRWEDLAEIKIDTSDLDNELFILADLLKLKANLDVNASFVGWVDANLPSQLAYVTLGGYYQYGFESKGCLIIDSNNRINLSMLGRYFLDAKADVGLYTAGASVDIVGALIPDIEGLPILQASIFTLVDISIYPQKFHIPINLGVDIEMGVVDQRFYFGPASANFDINIHHTGPVADADVEVYPLFLRGLGYGEEYHVNLSLDGIGKADTGAGNHRENDEPDSFTFKYAKFDGEALLYKKVKYCFLGLCYSEGWSGPDILFEEHSEDGTSYTQAEVDEQNELLTAFDFGRLNDLTSLGLYTLITGDQQLGQDYLACGIFQETVAGGMPNTPLYSDRTGQCGLVTDADYRTAGSASFYTDPACTNLISYNPVPFFEYCENNLLGGTKMKEYVGNANAWPDSGDYSSDGIKTSAWSLAHGPTLDILAVSSKSNMRPYLKQAEYRQVSHPLSGETCHLEMRVYKQDTQVSNLKPLMFIHGGSWTFRGAAALGMSSFISHLTERGYIVFAPYYRLMGTIDGPTACQVPSGTDITAPAERITEDVAAALAWVKANGDKFGATAGSQITLVGQSAGAHLAGWLASHYPIDIRNALLLYPPTDVEFFLKEALPIPEQPPGLYASTFEVAKGLVSEILNYQDFSELSATLDPENLPPLVLDNSFPRIVRTGINHPPTFMIHGNADTLVPIELSTIMCDALAGLPESTTPTAGGSYACGASRGITNILHVIPNADHILDLKCFLNPLIVEGFEGPQKYCPVGSLAGEEMVRGTLNEALQWLQ